MSGKALNITPLQWVLDPRASHHMTSQVVALENLHKFPDSIKITLPHGKGITVEKVRTINDGTTLVLRDVLYILVFTCNLISI